MARAVEPRGGADARTSLLLLAPAVVVLLVTNLYPTLNALWLSFFAYDASIPNATPVFVGLDNYHQLLTTSTFLNTARITVTFVLVAVVLELVIGITFGLLIARRRWFVGGVRVALLLPFMLAPVAAGVLWRTLFNVSWGPIDWLLGQIGIPPQEFLASPSQALAAVIAVEVWQQVPPVAFVVAAGISSLPPEIYRAAAVDGASARQTFWRVTLPLLRPVILVILLLRTMDAFKVYDIVATLTQGGPASETKVVSYLIWETGLRYLDLGAASAMSWAFLIVVFAISLLLIRALDRAREDVA
jgi:multiple sugar transport system permease protein